MTKFSFWQRHANPVSGWSRIATAPFFAAALWFVRYSSYTWIALVVVLIWAAINPIIFRKPKHLDRWISRGVLAEEWWIQKLRTKFEFDFTLLCNILAAFAFIPSVVIAFLPTELRNDLMWPFILCSAIAFLFKMWFVDRVTFQYDMFIKEQKESNKKS